MRKYFVPIFILLVVASVTLATLTTKLHVIVSVQNEKAVGLTTVKDNLGLDWTINLTNGDGANQANTLFHSEQTLSYDANETLDFNDSSLNDGFGTALTLKKIKVLAIYNQSADASLKIGGAASGQLGLFADVADILVLPPGGKFLYTAPLLAGLDTTTNSKLKLEHNGAGSSTLTYDIIVIGVD